jgi:peptidyl-tRNA hydrolase, PTH1 family
VKLIVSIGNPGLAYLNTRHNAGFLVVDALQNSKLPKDTVLRKSDVFMNESGTFVKKLVNNYKLNLNDLYVIHDDLDIKLGEYKIQFGRGPKDHNGLKSIDEELGTGEYWHIRVGVDNRSLDNKPMGEEYVLQNFGDEEKIVLETVIKRVVNDLIKKITTP